MMRRYQSSIQLISVLLVVLLMLGSIFPFGRAHAEETNQPNEKLSNELLHDFTNNEKVTFLVKFKDTANLKDVVEKSEMKLEKAMLSESTKTVEKRKAVIEELKDTSETSQRNVVKYLQRAVERGKAIDIQPLYIVNGLAVTATLDVAKKISSFEEVEELIPNKRHQLLLNDSKENILASISNENIEPNITKLKAPNVWEKGIDGSGVVVAVIDSGVAWQHPALKEKYRGFNTATGEVNHEFNWFDATDEQVADPHDYHGHGTHVTGTILGSEKNGSNQIGVAPGAKWIAVKAFTGTGATAVDLLEAAEWILAPTDSNGNERPDLAPDIVNNSWSSESGMDEWYRDIVKAWIAADIFPVFAAGNSSLSNPGGPGSIPNPANYPESFAVGSVNSNNALASTSLRGPSPYGEIKPDVVAEGVSVRSSMPHGGYALMSGTSMAAPAIAGVIALMKQATPSLSNQQLIRILKETTTPLTDTEYPTSPNNGYGYGLVNAKAAVELAIETAKINRISGYMRYDTAVEISKAGWEESETIILARGDNYADALAGVPLAKKLDAPILLTPSTKLWGSTREEITRLQTKKVIILGGEQAISDSIKRELVQMGLNVTRMEGKTRYETAAQIAAALSPSSSANAVLVNGLDFPDALSAAAYAAREQMPILLTRKDLIPEATLDTIRDSQVETTFVIGGNNVIDGSILINLPNPVRIYGENRYDTSVELAEHFGVPGNHIYIATGRGYADALAGAVLAAKNNSSILLVREKVPTTVSDFIIDKKITRLTIFGGENVVSNQTEATLRSLLK